MKIKNILFFICLLGIVTALQFDIGQREEKCIYEEIEHDSLVTGDFELMEPILLHPQIIIYNPQKQIIQKKETNQPGKFAFHTDQTGDYHFCFSTKRPQPNLGQGSSQRISFNYKYGIAARDYEDIAKKEHLGPLEREIRKMQDQVLEIHTDIIYAKGREEEMRNTNESTNSRVMWFSILSILVLFTTDLNAKLEICKDLITYMRNGETLKRTEVHNSMRLFLSVFSSTHSKSKALKNILELFVEFLKMESNYSKEHTKRILLFIEKRFTHLKDPESVCELLYQIIAILMGLNGTKIVLSLIGNWFESTKKEKKLAILRSYESVISLDFPNISYHKYLKFFFRFLVDENKEIRTKTKEILKNLFLLFGNTFLTEFKEETKTNEQKQIYQNFTKELKQNLAQTPIKHSKNQSTHKKPRSRSKPRSKIQSSKEMNLSLKKTPLKTQFSGRKNSSMRKKKKQLVPFDWESISQKIEPSFVDSEFRLEKVLANMKYTFENEKGEGWEKRIAAMIKLESLLNGGVSKYESFPQLLKSLLNSLSEQLKDLRSQIIKQCCFLIAHLSRRLGLKFKEHFLYLFRSLFALVSVTVQVISESVDLCIRQLILHTPTSEIIPLINSHLNSKNKIQRTRCIEYLLLTLRNCTTNKLSHYSETLFQIISKSLHDADSETRRFSRMLFWEYKTHFPQLGEKLKNQQDQTTIKNLINLQMTPIKKRQNQRQFSSRKKKKHFKCKTLNESDLKTIQKKYGNLNLNKKNTNSRKKRKTKRSLSHLPLNTPTKSSIKNKTPSKNFNNNFKLSTPRTRNKSQSISSSKKKIPTDSTKKILKFEAKRTPRSNKKMKNRRNSANKRKSYDYSTFQKTKNGNNNNPQKANQTPKKTKKDILIERNTISFSLNNTVEKKKKIVKPPKKSSVNTSTNSKRPKAKRGIPTNRNNNRNLKTKLKLRPKELSSKQLKLFISKVLKNIHLQKNLSQHLSMIIKLTKKNNHPKDFWEQYLLTILGQLFKSLHNPDRIVRMEIISCLSSILQTQASICNRSTSDIITLFLNSFESTQHIYVQLLLPFLPTLVNNLDTKLIIQQTLNSFENYQKNISVIEISINLLMPICPLLNSQDLGRDFGILINYLKKYIKHSTASIRKSVILSLVQFKLALGMQFEKKYLSTGLTDSELKLIHIYSSTSRRMK
ncbi:clip-associating protein [Anaeramoeba flamelloides]|uniref:Clip-associating protein n=1 Tax=Anaeramoeba flamelloides TaxID=1746091 RepID=A0ABQ8XAJ9_9EUKA|nr:clip-associating protein [Anaeramoeba flamelloides]